MYDSVNYDYDYDYDDSMLSFDIILVLLPTEYLHAPSAHHRAPTDPSRVRGLTYLGQGLGSERQW